MSKPLLGITWMHNCPNCNSNKVYQYVYKRETKYKCYNCKYEWSEKCKKL